MPLGGRRPAQPQHDTFVQPRGTEPQPSLVLSRKAGTGAEPSDAREPPGAQVSNSRWLPPGEPVSIRPPDTAAATRGAIGRRIGIDGRGAPTSGVRAAPGRPRPPGQPAGAWDGIRHHVDPAFAGFAKPLAKTVTGFATNGRRSLRYVRRTGRPIAAPSSSLQRGTDEPAPCRPQRSTAPCEYRLMIDRRSIAEHRRRRAARVLMATTNRRMGAVSSRPTLRGDDGGGGAAALVAV